ncbi:unnamed protein product [Arctia plantaginis]|uniref:Reverse transcriptase domain-containing protein n=1 Tax=Arctia plantaginis TaxID=874455 RepID=A0A8S1AQJ3_ARCPL|nr:unnamed protein product [Arctia plantaginis]
MVRCSRWRSHRSRVYVNKPETLEALKDNIRHECKNLSPEVLAEVMKNAIKRALSNQSDINTSQDNDLEPPTFKEVHKAINTLKNHKSPGIDNIPVEIWKYGEGALKSQLYKIWNLKLQLDFNLQQGGALSPILFNIGLEHIIRILLLINGGIELNGKHKIIGCADDLAILEQSESAVGDYGELRQRYNREIESQVSEPNIIGKIKAARLHWLGHVERMREDRAVKRAYLGQPIERRPVG